MTGRHHLYSPAHRPDTEPATISQLGALATTWYESAIVAVDDRGANTGRAGDAAHALVQYAIRSGGWSPADGIDHHLVPELTALLAAIRHLCDSIQIDFPQVAKDANERYLRELAGQGQA